MKEMEEFIEKDKLDSAKGDMFERICQRAEQRKASQMPKGVIMSLSLCCVIAALTLFANIFVQNNQGELLADQMQQEENFKAFAQENYFDILSDYYPEELLEQE